MSENKINFPDMKKKTAYLHYSVSTLLKIWILIFVLILCLLFVIIIVPDIYIMAHILYAACILSFIASLVWVYTKINLPYKRMEKAVYKFNLENDLSYINNCGVFYSEEIEKVFSRLQNSFERFNDVRATDVHAEYRALQNQINPHFLYNTLEAIRSDALCEGADNIANITEALATFFRYTISNVNSIVTLEAELNNLETYFAIQKYRFGNKVNLRINFIDEDIRIMEYQIPKLTLQPIIENAIIHGLEPKLGAGTIDIELAVIENRLVIKIADDGIGMDQSMLAKLNERLCDSHEKKFSLNFSEENSIGLFNVNSRIKLEFGENYGLRIKSIRNFGTIVELVLPTVKVQNRLI